MKFFTLECDWHKILEETRTAYQIWNQLIPPTAPSGQECDATLSKNTYNLINLTSPFPEYYSLWSQLFKNVRENMPAGPLWIHAWLNVHRSGELGKNSLGWHSTITQLNTGSFTLAINQQRLYFHLLNLLRNRWSIGTNTLTMLSN